MKEVINLLGGKIALLVATAIAGTTGYLECSGETYEQLTKALTLALTPAAVVVGTTAATMALLAQINLDPAQKPGRTRKLHIASTFSDLTQTGDKSRTAISDRERLLVSSWFYFMLGLGSMLFILLRVTFINTSGAPFLGALSVFSLTIIFSGLTKFGMTFFRFAVHLLKAGDSHYSTG